MALRHYRGIPLPRTPANSRRKQQPLPQSGSKGLFACPFSFRFPPSIPLPASRDPPEPVGEIASIGIAIPRELFEGRASVGFNIPRHPGKNGPFR